MRELHRRLFGQVWTWAGTYRATEKNIDVDPLHIAVRLRHLLDDARHWHEPRVFMPLEAAARFHHRLVQLHPFANGNGRHARIAADLFLPQYFDYPPIDWLAGQDLQSAGGRRAQYIAALRAADAHDFAPLLEFAGLP